MSGQLRVIAVPDGEVDAKVAEIESKSSFKVLAVDKDSHGFAEDGFSVIVFGRAADIKLALSS